MWAALLKAANNEWTLQQSYFLLLKKSCCAEAEKNWKEIKKIFFRNKKKHKQTKNVTKDVCGVYVATTPNKNSV